jgi:predicted enzyme related to lactoylglutathione lyase
MPAKRKSARKVARKKAAARPRKKAAARPRKKAAARPRRKAAARPRRKAAAKPRRKAVATRPARRAAPMAPPAPPSGIGLLNHHLDYTTYDLDGMRRFYTDFLGFREFTLDSSMNYLMVRTGSSSSLGFMPPMPGMDASPPREPGLYFMVKDVDRAHSDLVAKGVQFERPPADMPWGHRVAVTRDPEGRVVYLATVKTK